MTFRWPWRLNLTFDYKTNIIFWFLDPKNPLKMVSFVILTFFIFPIWLPAAILDFSKNGPLRTPLKLVFFDFLKTHGLRNKSWKFHNCTIICSGGYFHVPNPGQYMQITVCHFRKVTNKLLFKRNQKYFANFKYIVKYLMLIFSFIHVWYEF